MQFFKILAEEQKMDTYRSFYNGRRINPIEYKLFMFDDFSHFIKTGEKSNNFLVWFYNEIVEPKKEKKVRIK